jgi:predicted metal-dependent phosphotriesterase family hydrolase
MIDAVGTDHCLLFSDFGQPVNPPVVEGLKLFIGTLLALGISEEKIKTMVKHNPEKLLDIA